MKNKFLVLTLMLVGCADPVYVPSAESTGQLQKSTSGACSVKFKVSGACLDWQWEKAPTENQAGTFLFWTYRNNIAGTIPVLLDQASLPEVVLWMPGMNHGSSPVQTQQEDVGTYRASEVFFIMPGEWEIKFQIKEGDQILDEAIVPLTL